MQRVIINLFTLANISMKNAFFIIVLFFALGVINVVMALPSKCLQAESRENPCPHLLYKKAALKVESLDVKKCELICLCLTDLAALHHPAKSKVANINQQATFERLIEQHQLTEQDVLTLLRY